MAGATSMPIVMLGGDPGADAARTFAGWKAAMNEPNVRGLVAGRALVYEDGDVERAVTMAANIVTPTRSHLRAAIARGSFPRAVRRTAAPIVGSRRNLPDGPTAECMSSRHERMTLLSCARWRRGCLGVVVRTELHRHGGRYSVDMQGREGVFAAVSDWMYLPVGLQVAIAGTSGEVAIVTARPCRRSRCTTAQPTALQSRSAPAAPRGR